MSTQFTREELLTIYNVYFSSVWYQLNKFEEMVNKAKKLELTEDDLERCPATATALKKKVVIVDKDEE